MRKRTYIIWLLAMLTLVGCGTKKKAANSGRKARVEQQTVETPAWHTCLTQARATITTDEDKLSANIAMQSVRDSMLVISIMPLLGMEMIRVEATPTELTAIDKMQGRYATASFADLNRKFTPSLNWDILQQVCSAELPTGTEKARLQYTIGDKTVELVIDYGQRQTDVPVRVNRQRLDKYTAIDISKWL